MASLTLTLLMVMTRGLARQNEAEPNHTYQTWHKALRETLNQVALRLEIPFPVFRYKISPFWLPSFVQAEFNLDVEAPMCGGDAKSHHERNIGLLNLRQRTLTALQLPGVCSKSEELAASNLRRLRPSGSPTIKETTGTEH